MTDTNSATQADTVIQTQQRREHLLEEKKQQQLEYLKDIVMRQTDYSEEQTLLKLKEHNNDIMAIVREFMGIPIRNKVKETKQTVNQQIYSEIRTLMDDAAASYKARKEAEEKRQIYIENMRNELLRRKKIAEDASKNNISSNDSTTSASTSTSTSISSSSTTP